MSDPEQRSMDWQSARDEMRDEIDQKIADLASRWREKLRAAGVLDNDMISVPGDGAIKMLEEFENLLKS